MFCVFLPKLRHHPEPKHKHHPEPKHRHHTEGDSYAYVKYLKINKYARAHVRTTRVAAFEVREIRRIQTQGEPLLFQAATNGDKDRAEELIKAGVRVDGRDEVLLPPFLLPPAPPPPSSPLSIPLSLSLSLSLFIYIYIYIYI